MYGGRLGGWKQLNDHPSVAAFKALVGSCRKPARKLLEVSEARSLDTSYLLVLSPHVTSEYFVSKKTRDASTL